MTVQQLLLFAAPSAVAGVAVLWLAIRTVLARRTAAVRDGLRLDLAMPPAWALDLAAAQFAVTDWVRADGDGAVNRQHILPGRPAISVEAVPGPGDSGSEVHVWMSAWTHLGELVRYAGVARDQMRALEDVLRAADQSYGAPVPTVSTDVLDLLIERRSSRGSSAA